MTTKQEIIFSILNTIRGGKQSNTELISEEEVSWNIDNVRAKLIRQDLMKKRSINPDIVQTLCIDLEQVDPSDCPCEITGCTIIRSVQQIPPAVEIDNKNLIISVGPIDMSKPRFSLLPYDRFTFYNPNKFSRSIIGSTIHNGYLYLVGSDNKVDLLEVCTMNIVLERPENAKTFTCTGTPCYSVDSKYPVSAIMIPDIQSYIFEKILRIEASAPNDESGDGKHNLQSPEQR